MNENDALKNKNDAFDMFDFFKKYQAKLQFTAKKI